jgi:hypothetical protein
MDFEGVDLPYQLQTEILKMLSRVFRHLVTKISYIRLWAAATTKHSDPN